MSSHCSALALLALAASLGAAPAGVAPRAGLPNFTRALAAGEHVRLVCLGGTATASVEVPGGKDLPGLLSGAFRRSYPKASLRVVNQGLPETGSWLGVFRTDTEVVQHYVPLGLTVVEFAPEDAAEPPARVLAAVEGIVRKIRRAKADSDILFLYTARPEWLAEYRQGRVPEVVVLYERVAEHYGIPSVDGGAWLARQDGEWPGDEAVRAAYAEAVAAYAAELAPAAAEAQPHALPAPLGERPLEQANLATYERATWDEGWLDWQESPLSRFFHVLHGTRPEATVTCRFQGDAVGLYAPLETGSADFLASVDGGPWQRVVRATPGAKARAEALVVAENLDPATVHELRLRLAPEGDRAEARLAFFLVNGKVVFDDPRAGMTPLERLDAIYATMDPVTFQPAADRWRHLPKTMARLADGPELTIVMLGDSIVNDTAHSEYQHLLMRRYPKCQIKVVRSVRGSTGCWWYKDENRVQSYVLDHQPDLLMIGGISQRDDTESIRAVIQQVRAARPGLEILLMTGAVGSSDPRTDPAWTEEVPEEGESYRTRLRRLAREENCEFLDMTGPWGRYIRDSRHALGSFKRDVVHANDRGKQVLGRILDAYFTSKP
ncbi:MAG: SGNH/GDSL hydrolase family protein [Lentisphaeria bacterium]|jgi:hypothetical protein|nr:SGNH/GDSL hydrolase family protein [Lentisphaeria bacterium]